MELRQLHISARAEIEQRVNFELFPTPIDNNDPARPPPSVGSDCGTEIEAHARFRRVFLRAIAEFYRKIESDDEQLFQQAGERGLPPELSKPQKTVR